MIVADLRHLLLQLALERRWRHEPSRRPALEAVIATLTGKTATAVHARLERRERRRGKRGRHVRNEGT